MAHTNNPGSQQHAESIEQLKLMAQNYAWAWKAYRVGDIPEAAMHEREEELRQAALHYADVVVRGEGHAGGKGSR